MIIFVFTKCFEYIYSMYKSDDFYLHTQYLSNGSMNETVEIGVENI